MKCLNCGRKLPSNSHKSRKYCNLICQKEFYRNKYNPNRKLYNVKENKTFKEISEKRFYNSEDK